MVNFEGVGHQLAEAIRYEGSGQVADSSFKAIGAAGAGTAVVAKGGTVIVYKSSFAEIGRSAVLVTGAGQSTSVLGDRIVGSGSGTAYGVEVEGGAHADIRNSTISGFSGVGGEGRARRRSSSAARRAGTQATVLANELRDATVGLAVDGAGGPATVEARSQRGGRQRRGHRRRRRRGAGRRELVGLRRRPRDERLRRPRGPRAGTRLADPPTRGLGDDCADRGHRDGHRERHPGLSGPRGIGAFRCRQSRTLESERPEEEGVGMVGFADGASVNFAAAGQLPRDPGDDGRRRRRARPSPPSRRSGRRPSPRPLDHATAETSLQVVSMNAGGGKGGAADGGAAGAPASPPSPLPRRRALTVCAARRVAMGSEGSPATTC